MIMYVSVYELNNGSLVIKYEDESNETCKVFDADGCEYVNEAAEAYRALVNGADPVDDGWCADEADLSDKNEILFLADQDVYVHETRCGYAGMAFLAAVGLRVGE